MPIAFTNHTVLYSTFLASTRTQMVDAVNGALVSVGWSSSSVTGGYRLEATSPQGLGIYLFVRDLGHAFGAAAQVTFNFETLDGTITGIDHDIQVDSSAVYQIVAGCCQLFISNIGLAYSQIGSNFCGGIPFFPGASSCFGEVPATPAPSQGFWACGDYSTGVGNGGPRNQLNAGGDLGQSEALWGTDYCAAGNIVGTVRIPIVGPASSITSGLNYPSPILMWNGDFIVYEPFLVWGLSSSTLPKLRAQIWDAAIFSKSFPMDYTQTNLGYFWINYTNSYNYGSLQLLIPDARSGNYAYIAT